MLCSRCGRDTYKYKTCNYCKRKICNACTKSSKRISKTVKLVICKDDWSKMPTRTIYKAAKKDS